MRIGKFYSSKKFFWQIILLTSAAVSLLVLVLSTTIYINSQHILLKKENEANKKVFDQIKINISMMDTMASNLCKSLYANSDVTAIMYAKEEDYVNITNKTFKIVNTVIQSNPNIHSITIYNNYLGQYYNAGKSIYFNDKQISEIKDGKKLIPKLKCVSRALEQVVNEKIQYENVFSYFMYENSGNKGELDGAIAVNISIDWFLENLKQINMIDKDRGDNVFVLNKDGQFIEVGNENDKIEGWIKNEYDRNMNKSLSYDQDGSFQSKYNGVNYLVTYSYINSMDITILKIQKTSEVYQSINSLRVSIIVTTVLFLFAALLIFVGISKKIYKPVGSLVQLVSSNRNQNGHGVDCTDEISYLNDFCTSTIEKLDMYKKEEYAHRDIMRNYWINKLLTDSHSINMHKIRSIFEECKISLSTDESYIVCILSIDYYKSFVNEYDSKTRELLRFSVINISSEIIGGKYKNEGMDMKDDHVALIIGVPNEDESCMENLTALIRKSQEYIKQYLKLSVSASVSLKDTNLREVTSLYGKAVDYIMYRLRKGHNCIITPECVDSNKDREYRNNIKELETLIVDRIKSADIDGAEDILKKIFIEISNLDYDCILVSLVNTASYINNAIDNHNVPGLKLKHFDFNYVCQNIMEKETLDEIYNVMTDRLKDIFENKSEDPEQSKNSYIVSAVRDFIEKNYPDSSLSLTKISDVMNISTRRLSKIFKDEMHTFIPDYINEVRLSKAAELLESTSLNVNEIVSRLGIDNETYFYKIFKYKYGITPKEYAFKRIVNMTLE